MKLLIAVKSEIIANTLAASLSMHDVHICHTGADALAMLPALQPELLLLELSLPVIDGLALLHRSYYRPKYILALSRLMTPAVLQAAADAGVHTIISLPCTAVHVTKQLNALAEKAPSTE